MSHTPLGAVAWRSTFGYLLLFAPLFHVLAAAEHLLREGAALTGAAIGDLALDLTVATVGLLAFAAVPTLMLHVLLVGLAFDRLPRGWPQRAALALAPAGSLLVVLSGLGLLFAGVHGFYAAPFIFLGYPVAFLVATLTWSAFLGYGLRAVQRAEADV